MIRRDRPIEKIGSELFPFRLGRRPEIPEQIISGPQSIENLQDVLVWRERVCIAWQRCPVLPNLKNSFRCILACPYALSPSRPVFCFVDKFGQMMSHPAPQRVPLIIETQFTHEVPSKCQDIPRQLQWSRLFGGRGLCRI